MTTRGRVLRSHTRTNRSARFNQLLELTTALSEADRETKEKVETAEILSLLGLGRKIEPARAPQQQGQLPLPTIQHIAPQPQAQQQPQQPLHQQQAIRPAAAKPSVVPVLPAPGSNAVASATTAAKAITKPVEGEKKRKRSKTTPDQLRILMEEFQREPMPNANTRQTLAARLSMTPRSVQIWFQNMRAKVKKANAMSGSAPGEGNKNNCPPLTDPAHESDGPARKRQRTVTGEEDNNCSNNNNNSKKMDVEQKQPQPQARRSSITGSSSVVIPSATKLPAHVPLAPAKSTQQQPIKIAANPQSAFAPTNASAAANGPKARTTEQSTPTSAVAGKLPLPPIQHAAGQPPIFGVSLQYIPQSYHCDQLKRAMPSIAALTNSVQQMTA
jgi:hypothetical protein